MARAIRRSVELRRHRDRPGAVLGRELRNGGLFLLAANMICCLYVCIYGDHWRGIWLWPFTFKQYICPSQVIQYRGFRSIEVLATQVIARDSFVSNLLISVTELGAPPK